MATPDQVSIQSHIKDGLVYATVHWKETPYGYAQFTFNAPKGKKAQPTITAKILKECDAHRKTYTEYIKQWKARKKRVQPCGPTRPDAKAHKRRAEKAPKEKYRLLPSKVWGR